MLPAWEIKIVHQIPRSPETNVLDLGIWCALQWAVDRMMRGQRGDVHALVEGVQRVWSENGLDTQFTNVWNRLKRVLILIAQDDGGNSLVESHRGKQFGGLDEVEDLEEIDGIITTAQDDTDANVDGVLDLLDSDVDDVVDD